jgi:hypothetical protein
MKLGKPKGTSAKPKKKTVPSPKEPPSWLADKWNKAKVAGGAAMTLGTGIALGSMIPFAASKDTESDIERMRQG